MNNGVANRMAAALQGRKVKYPSINKGNGETAPAEDFSQLFHRHFPHFRDYIEVSGKAFEFGNQDSFRLHDSPPLQRAFFNMGTERSEHHAETG